VWLIISQIAGFVKYSEQAYRFEKLRAQIKKLENHKSMTKGLIKEFRTYLGEKFPDLEMEFFKNFQNDTTDTRFILAYPELKSSKTMIRLVDKINELTDSTNDRLSYIEDSCYKIRYYDSSKWELFKPAIPSDLEQYL
jgi:hypothetical protein